MAVRDRTQTWVRPARTWLCAWLCACAVLSVLCGLASPARAEPGTVTLQDGTRVDGDVLLHVPGKKVVLEADGQTYVFEAERVANVEVRGPRLGSEAPPASRPAPGAAASVPEGSTASLPPVQLGQIDLLRYAQIVRVQRLIEQRDALKDAPHAWHAPLTALCVGVASMIVGGIVFHTGWSRSDYSVAMDRTGLILMPTGAAIVIATTPILAIRLSRSRRLQRAEERLRELGLALAAPPHTF